MLFFPSHAKCLHTPPSLFLMMNVYGTYKVFAHLTQNLLRCSKLTIISRLFHANIFQRNYVIFWLSASENHMDLIFIVDNFQWFFDEGVRGNQFS